MISNLSVIQFATVVGATVILANALWFGALVFWRKFKDQNAPLKTYLPMVLLVMFAFVILYEPPTGPNRIPRLNVGDPPVKVHPGITIQKVAE